MRTDDTGARYVYSVVESGGPAARIRAAGLEGAAVEAIPAGPLAALVSSAPAGRVRPSRANLRAHEQVVAAAHRAGAVLPVRFATVMPDAAAVVTDLLEPGIGTLDDMLREFHDKDEFRIRAQYLPDVALREAVEGSPRLQRLRSRVMEAGDRAGPAPRMRLGEMVVSEMARLQEIEVDTVCRRIAPSIAALKELDARSDEVPVHIAVLVDRHMAVGLERAVQDLAAEQQDRLKFELTGPLPPWDFGPPRMAVA